MKATIENLVKQVKEGNKDALETLIRSIQDFVYGLAIRMLYYPAEAEDATQEILVKIITKLDTFRHESAFTTWVYKIASNHLLTINKCHTERIEMTFEKYGQQLDRWIANATPTDHSHAEQHLMVREIMLRCMQGMLICLDRNLRIAYILGEIFEVSSDEAALILNTSSLAFRKRLSRARTHLRHFMQKKCGLVNPSNPCHCIHHVNRVINSGLARPDSLIFATHPCHAQDDAIQLNQIKEMKTIERVAALFRSHPDYAAPEAFVLGIRKLVDSGKFEVFNN